MKLALMQPYFFPYAGYFHLIWKTDTFIFYDDVAFIKQGWINRNKILLNSSPHYFTIPCKCASSNIEIRHVGVDRQNPAYRKLPKLIESAYSKAPYFAEIFPIVQALLKEDHPSISSLAAESVIRCCDYLQLKRRFLFSSESCQSTYPLKGQDRVLAIAALHGATVYINSPGGRSLYEKSAFDSQGIALEFSSPAINKYEQFNKPFVPSLSILDILMFNSREKAGELICAQTEPDE
jgi:hypothetical protein